VQRLILVAMLYYVKVVWKVCGIVLLFLWVSWIPEN